MKKEIKKLALERAKKSGLMNLTHEGLCQAAGIAPGNFQHIMGRSFTEFIEELYHEIGPQTEFSHSKRGRLNPNLRKDMLLNVAVSLAEKKPYTSITPALIADKAGVSVSSVIGYYTSVSELQNAIMRAALERKILSIIAVGIAVEHPLALNAPQELRNKALKSLNT